MLTVKMRLFSFFLFFLITTVSVSGQNEYPDNYFRSPIDFKILLSGTFAELRTNHFHSGIDIKTGGAQGKKIYAVAEGYISRIKISPSGYGKALYLTHPNGYVSVYGHLKKFTPELNDFIRKEQYKQKSFPVDISVEPNKFIFKKGEVIAFSGNTGSSSGPHLHFEIRDQKTQYPINPLLFGIEVKDWIRPKILSLKVYAADKNSMVNGKCDTLTFQMAGWGPEYRIKNSDTIFLSGNVAFGLKTYDHLNDASNKNGPFSIELFVDSVLHFSSKAEKFSFNETRYINAFIDYNEYKTSKSRYVQTFIAPNNHLSIYGDVINNGIVEFNDNKIHLLQFIVQDIKKNKSVLTFYVKATKITGGENSVKEQSVNRGTLFLYNKPNQFESNGLIIKLPEGVLYQDILFEYDVSDKMDGMVSKIHHIHTKFTPVHKYYKISIKPDSLPERLLQKAYIVRYEDGKNTTCGGGILQDYIAARVNSFGDYCIRIDTIPPEIKPVNFKNNMSVSSLTQIKFIISDEGSGIKSYTGMINDQWILMEY
ncbi:MAG: M23 family metallopeptidase, partial [Bacteroidales bacterium]|nr:M23 family metallopeptidase [Bacteroidales bacterium]